MIRLIASCLFILLALPSFAQSCPDFFRFVDFGQEDRDGNTLRGGTILRGESLEGRSLLLRSETVCRDVREIASDGHGNPIPVVTSILYDPTKIDVAVQGLRVSLMDDVGAAAEVNARRHRNRVSRADVVLTRGPTFLCASHQETQGISCQVTSPYPGNIPLVIYCNPESCRASVFAMTSRIAIDAIWATDASRLDNPETAGPAIVEQIEDIYKFMESVT